MRAAFLFLFLASSLCAQAARSMAGLERVQLFGRDYVRMTEWAKANNVRLAWTQKEKFLRATNSNFRILFEINSRRAQINGINFMLSREVLLQRGSVYISAVDLQDSLHPILFPEKMNAGETIKTICLDPGHGGSDPGKLQGKMEEKKLTLLLSEELEDVLKEAGFRVVRTRTRDQAVERSDRPRLANQKDADLFLSLHFNAEATSRIQGAEVYCLTPTGTISSNGGTSASAWPGHAQTAQSTLLAYQMQKTLVKNLRMADRGVKRSQFVVLLTPKMPAILIEGGFMTNPGEAKKIYDPAFRKQLARAIADGIFAYKKIVEQKASQ